MVHPIRVEHWDELEHKVFPQHLGSEVIWSEDELQETIEDVAGGSLSRMHSAGEKEHLWVQKLFLIFFENFMKYEVLT